MPQDSEDKYMPENHIPALTDKALAEIGDTYADFYLFRGQRDGQLIQFQNRTLLDVLKTSRQLFWNSTKTDSEDLEELGLDFSLPFTRKEVMDFVGAVTSQNMKAEIMGEGLDSYGVKVLQAIYKKWRLKSNDKVEKFWQMLYGATNGTLCTYVGFDGNESTQRYLTQFDKTSGQYKINEKKVKKWNDVTSTIVPLEEMFMAKIWERDVQKQGKTIRYQQMNVDDFKAMFPESIYSDAKYVRPGNRIDANSLFFQLLSGTGITDTNRIGVLTMYDTNKDQKKVMANGVWLDRLGKDTVSPNPFHHKMQPYTWTITSPQDEKFCYGVPIPFTIKDLDRILNTSTTMQVERELRTIDPPILTSDFEAPELIFGDKRVIPVNDINAYKELKLAEPSGQFSLMQNSMQGLMSSFVNGGTAQVAPSRQPKAAREIIAINAMKQEALGNTLTMYYNLIYQEMFLVLKTALQFYSAGKYSANKDDLVRSITVPNFQLTQGGMGNLEVRITKSPQDGLKLYFESVLRGIDDGKSTEIIEIPPDLLKDLSFYISDIKLESEQADELEKAAWNEQVLAPLMNFFIPAGVASIEKTFLRWAEKNNEHPADFASDKAKGQVITDWAESFNVPKSSKSEVGATTGNLNQSITGTMFGGQSNGGLGLTPEVNSPITG